MVKTIYVVCLKNSNDPLIAFSTKREAEKWIKGDNFENDLHIKEIKLYGTVEEWLNDSIVREDEEEA